MARSDPLPGIGDDPIERGLKLSWSRGWSLRRRILAVNVITLLLVALAILFLDSFRNQLMDAAYSDDIYVDDRTIDSHIKRLRRKFRGADPSFDAIETLYGAGYRFSEE